MLLLGVLYVSFTKTLLNHFEIEILPAMHPKSIKMAQEIKELYTALFGILFSGINNLKNTIVMIER